MARAKAEWIAPLSALPQPTLPWRSAWSGHIPFLFLLFSLAKPKSFVELGVFHGASFTCACDAAQRTGSDTRCVGVDTWLGDAHIALPDGEQVFQSLSRLLGQHFPAAELLRETFDQAATRFPPSSVDLLHIDGLHTYEAVSHDFRTWKDKLSHQAIVLFHDTEVRDHDFGVWKLWAELKREYRHYEFLHSYGLGILAIGKELPRAFDEWLSAIEADAGFADWFRGLCAQAAATLPGRIERRDRGDLRRNELCHCGSGRRFKHCHGQLN